MNIKVLYIEDAAIIEIEGKVNINSSKLIETVGSLLDGGIRKIVIDMENVDFIDYNGLSVLAIAYKSVLNRKGVMKLCAVGLHLMELLRIVKLEEVFEIYNNLDDALESFKKGCKVSKISDLQQPLRRKFQRLDLDMPVIYKPSKDFSHKGEGHLHSGRIANISGAGIFIRTINIILPGSEVLVEMAIEKDKKPMSLKGVVLWLADKDLQPDLYPGMGVVFERLSSNTQEEIIEFIEKNTAHRRG